MGRFPALQSKGSSFGRVRESGDFKKYFKAMEKRAETRCRPSYCFSHGCGFRTVSPVGRQKRVLLAERGVFLTEGRLEPGGWSCRIMHKTFPMSMDAKGQVAL